MYNKRCHAQILSLVACGFEKRKMQLDTSSPIHDVPCKTSHCVLPECINSKVQTMKVIWTLKRQIINDSSRWTLLRSFLRLSYLNLTSTAVVSSSFHTAFVFARGGEGGGTKLMFFRSPSWWAPVLLYSVSFPLHDWRQYQHFCGLVACPASQFTSRKGHSTKTALSKIGSKRIFGNFIKLLS